MSKAQDKQDKADAKAEAESHDKHEKAHHRHADHGGPHFARAGNRIVNLAHVVDVSLPVEGDPKQPLQITLATGTNLQLVGDDADEFLAELCGHCDAKPRTPEKEAAKQPPV